MADQTKSLEGSLPEKPEALTVEKKKGRAMTRYIRPIDTQTKADTLVSSRPPLSKKNAKRITPAPAMKSRNLKNND